MLVGGTNWPLGPTAFYADGQLAEVGRCVLSIIDNVELDMYKEILYCENLVCGP